MKRFRNFRMPSPAMLIAVIALVVALGGTAVAAKKLSLGALSDGAKNKTVGVGKLTYVQTPHTVLNPEPTDGYAISAACPSGLRVIGGGIKGQDPNTDFIFDSYPTTTGWAGRVYPGGGAGTSRTFIVTAICANSRAVTGAPPSS
ncbi:MAG: hypothetical protein ACRDK5_02180 [Solirubrobacterales bacterium]